MPMSDPSGRWWIVYNGETYNFQQLREELAGLGYTFTSTSDFGMVSVIGRLNSLQRASLSLT